MKKEYVSHDEYADLPTIYGRHAPYWCSLSFAEKMRTILHVGFISFIREIIGYADAERIKARLELEYAASVQRCETAEGRISELEEEVAKLTEELKSAKQACDIRSSTLLTPPSAEDIVRAFNKMCPEKVTWFYLSYENPDSGVIHLSHGCSFYPFWEIMIPRGKLRLCNRYGYPVCLMQNYDYKALPPEYAEHLVPSGHHPRRMRVLFVTHSHDTWLSEPLSAQDVVLEIYTLYQCEGNPGAHRGDAAYDAGIAYWKDKYKYALTQYGSHANETILTLMISMEEFLCVGRNKFSKEQIQRIREQCYAEYLDYYFGGE